MYLYKYNHHTGEYYQYDMDDHDMFSPMFDDYLHPQDDNFEISYITHPEFAMRCAFCKTEFPSRNQLFKHLGYMGINIRPKLKMGPLKSKYNETKGDYGYFVKEKSSTSPPQKDTMECDMMEEHDCCKHTHDINALCHRFDTNMCVE